MSRVVPLTWFLLVDFSRSLRVVVPPGLLLALYRVFFLYGSDAQYFGAVGAIMLGFICIVTTLLLAGGVNQASSYPLVARLPRRQDLIAAVVLASLIITLILGLVFVAAILILGQVPLEAQDLAAIAVRWLAIFILAVTFALHLSRLVSRAGSNLVAYFVLILALISYQRLEYPSFVILDWAENIITGILQAPTQLISGGAALGTADRYAIALALTLLYSLLLYLLAVWLFRQKDLVWAE